MGIEATEDRNYWSLRQFLLNGTDLLGLTPSELQCGESRLKGIRDIWGEIELFGMKARDGEQLSPREKCWQRPLFLF